MPARPPNTAARKAPVLNAHSTLRVPALTTARHGRERCFYIHYRGLCVYETRKPAAALAALAALQDAYLLDLLPCAAEAPEGRIRAACIHSIAFPPTPA